MTCLQLLDTCYSINFLLLKKVEIIGIISIYQKMIYYYSYTINAVCFSGLICVCHIIAIFGVRYNDPVKLLIFIVFIPTTGMQHSSHRYIDNITISSSFQSVRGNKKLLLCHDI